jgi:hypothetical protein
MLLLFLTTYFWSMQLGITQLKNSAGETYVTVYYDDDCRWTVDIWTGEFETVENFTYGLMTVLENIREFRAKKWLADLSKIEGNFEFAKSFIADTVVPTAMKYGLEFEALVLPNNIFAMLSVQEALQKINDLEIRIFGTVEEAKKWLEDKTPSSSLFKPIKGTSRRPSGS